MKKMGLLIICLLFSFQAHAWEITLTVDEVQFPDFVKNVSTNLKYQSTIIDDNGDVIPNPESAKDFVNRYYQCMPMNNYNTQLGNDYDANKATTIENDKMTIDDVTLSLAKVMPVSFASDTGE